MKFSTSLLLGAPLLLAALAPSARAQAKPAGEQLARILERITEADTNHDGAITRQEWTDFRSAQFARLDRNHDGFLSADDLPRRAAASDKGKQFARLIEALDQNGDGKLSREEFIGGTRLFDWLDKDHNGVIDAQELAQARQARP